MGYEVSIAYFYEPSRSSLVPGNSRKTSVSRIGSPVEIKPGTPRYKFVGFVVLFKKKIV
jgi:hypothetical protein